ncbi:enoyl-CoA hydratase/isomerase family protein [Glutamicibacter arilaitensis]|uniref:enoyl-CoA hydratase/isomerase family protein n=1 Tax=Glutamicibacter arilaitensis TaxID=256701 RepID=UPI003FD359DF
MTHAKVDRTVNTPGRIRVRRDSGVSTLLISNPKRRNALDQTMCIELEELMLELDRDPQTTVIVLRGEGKDFSAGAALNDLESVLFADVGNGETIDYLSRADAAIRAARKPTIALVRGVCMGGGWQIAAACDILLAADDCRIAITPAKLGILYPRPGLERLVDRVGADRAKFLLYSGVEVSPLKAEAWGLVSELIEADLFEAQVREYCTTVAARSQFAVTSMGHLVDQLHAHDVDQQWAQLWAEFQTHEDLAHGRASFLAGKKPVFSWRLD